MGMVRRGWLAAALSLVFGGILAWQLLLPHFIGLANNADFGKVSGWLSLAPPDSWNSNFLYFQPDYIRSQRDYWRSPYYSSETVLAWLAVRLSRATTEGAHFDIRALGALHAALCIAAFWVMLVALGRAPVWRVCAAAGAAMVCFTDVCYTAYLNSFYMDAAALCGLLLLAASAAWIAAAHEPSAGQFLLCGLAGLIYVTSKTQHAIWMLLPVVFVAAHSLRARSRPARLAGFAAGAILMAGGTGELATADAGNRAQALFNKIFFQIANTGPDARADLRELGVRPEEFQYAGIHSYIPGSPALDMQWIHQFYARTGYGRLLAWYLRHPSRAARIMNDALVTDAPMMRPDNLSNFRREEGHPAGARTDRFAAWSDLRSALLARWPYHIVLWYALFTAGAIATVRGRPHTPASRVAWLGLGIAALGIGHFLVASLADCLETGRHLFPFHVCTDLTVCFAAAFFVRLKASDAKRSHFVLRDRRSLNGGRPPNCQGVQRRQ